MSDPRNDQPEDLVGRAVAALRELPLPAGPSDAVASRTLAALCEAANRPKSSLRERIRHMPWTSKAIAALATAASLLVVYIGISTFAGSALAFADVVAALNSIRTATWKSTSDITLPDNKTHRLTSTGMFLAPSHERIETDIMGTTNIQILDGQRDKILFLYPSLKTAQIINLKNLPTGKESGYGRTFESMRQLVISAKDNKSEKVERLEAQIIDGRRAEGFCLSAGTVEVSIWADPNTSVPIRVEMRSSVGTPVHITMTDFHVNDELDPALFSLDLPKDYKLQEVNEIDVSRDPMLYVADALKLVADLNNGVFPPDLRGKHGMEGVLMQGGLGLRAVNAEMQERLRHIPMVLGGALGFLGALSAENNDWHYAGKDVKLNTPDKPIFWYRKNRSSTTYHVLHADLTVKEVPADRVPKTLPAAANPNP